MGSARPSHFTLTAPGPLRLYSTTELLRLPPPAWLIPNMIPEGGVVVVYGQPGCGKSFLIQDLTLSLGCGLPWMGFGEAGDPRYGVYVAAEAGGGLGVRVQAWLQARNISSSRPQVAWLMESLPVYAGSDDLVRLTERLSNEIERLPRFIVIDTLARCFDGDENQQEDMGRFIAGVDALRKEWGVTVIVVHHTRLDGKRERGNTALKGAADTMILVEAFRTRGARGIRVKCTKQRDYDEFAGWRAHLCPVEGTESCVLEPVVARDGVASDEDSDTSSDPARQRDEALLAHLADGSLPSDVWRAQTTLTRATFYRAVQRLQRAGTVRRDPESNEWRIA